MRTAPMWTITRARVKLAKNSCSPFAASLETAEPHIHLGYETGIYVLEGTVMTRWGANLENETVSQTGDFLFIPPAYRTRQSTLVFRPVLARWLRAMTLRNKTGSNATPPIAVLGRNCRDLLNTCAAILEQV